MEQQILFQGDSITDGNRYKALEEAGDFNHQMGHSYAYVINALLGSQFPERGYRFLNRGVSGNRVRDLYARMEEDILSLKPDILSILVGVNDGPTEEWGGIPTGKESYEHTYRSMLWDITQSQPDVRLVLCEPFVVNAGWVKKEYGTWRSCMDDYRASVRRLSEEFNAVFVPLQELFDDQCRKWAPEYWCWDGIHPTENGHGLIARQWMECMGGLLA